MALATYSELLAAVYDRLQRAPEANVFDNSLALAEAEINRRLALNPVRPMHQRQTSTINAEFIATPSGILDVDSFKVINGENGSDLVYSSPQNLEEMAQAGQVSGTPKFYTQIGSEFRFYPSPDGPYIATLTAWMNVPKLTVAAAVNWLLTAHPDVYFHGVLAHSYQHYYDDENSKTQGELFDSAIAKVLDAYPHRVERRPLTGDVAGILNPYRQSVLA
jgi:hypothetical protein